MKKIFLVASFWSMCAVPAFAGEAETKVAMEVTRLVLPAESYNQMVEQMVEGMFAAVSPEAEKKTQLLKMMKEILPYEQVVKLNAELYGKHFSIEELKDLLAFYKTPTGKKLAKVLPVISGEAARTTAQWLPERLPAAMKKYKLTE